MSKYDLLVIDKDECPRSESVISEGQCTYCEYYEGLKEESEQPCIICSYCFNNSNSEKAFK